MILQSARIEICRGIQNSFLLQKAVTTKSRLTTSKNMIVQSQVQFVGGI